MGLSSDGLDFERLSQDVLESPQRLSHSNPRPPLAPISCLQNQKVLGALRKVLGNLGFGTYELQSFARAPQKQVVLSPLPRQCEATILKRQQLINKLIFAVK